MVRICTFPILQCKEMCGALQSKKAAECVHDMFKRYVYESETVTKTQRQPALQSHPNMAQDCSKKGKNIEESRSKS